MAWEEALKIAAPVIQAVSVAITAYFAVKGLNAWRRQLLGKRRIEIAEEALVAAYKVKNAMSYIRSPGSFGGEGGTRPRVEGENEDLARVKDSYFVPLERMQKTSPDFAEFEKMRLLCQVHFGVDATKPFDEILKARHKVVVAARVLISTADDRAVQQGFREQLRGDIWESYGSGGDVVSDAIVKSVTGAVEQIEAMCRPHLKL
jgi:hypothetical protein